MQHAMLKCSVQNCLPIHMQIRQKCETQIFWQVTRMASLAQFHRHIQALLQGKTLDIIFVIECTSHAPFLSANIYNEKVANRCTWYKTLPYRLLNNEKEIHTETGVRTMHFGLHFHLDLYILFLQGSKHIRSDQDMPCNRKTTKKSNILIQNH